LRHRQERHAARRHARLRVPSKKTIYGCHNQRLISSPSDWRNVEYSTGAAKTEWSPRFCMNDSNSSSNAQAPRPTLKLKVGARKAPAETKTSAPTAPAPQSNAKSKPGAHWSDEYKARMQADMDALLSR
jgi:hypothetical protein